MTPQEAANEAFENYWKSLGYGLRDNITDEEIRPWIESFISGAKWQSEQDQSQLSSELKEIEELRDKNRVIQLELDNVNDYTVTMQKGLISRFEDLKKMPSNNFRDVIFLDGAMAVIEAYFLKNTHGLPSESHPKSDSANLPPESAS